MIKNIIFKYNVKTVKYTETEYQELLLRKVNYL